MRTRTLLPRIASLGILWLLVSPFQSRGVSPQAQLLAEELASFQLNLRQEAPARRSAQRPQADSARPKPRLPSQTYPSVFVDQRVRLSLPALDMAKIRQEDEAAKGKPNQSSRIGISRPTAVSNAMRGRWVTLGPVGRAWVLWVSSQGAIAVRVHFAKFSLPEGARLFLYAPSEDPQIETFEDRGPFGDGDFWSPSISGDTVVLELLDPSSSNDTERANFFEIVEIGHIYRDRVGREQLEPVITAASSGSQPELETCHLDATCYSEWSSTGDAVAGIHYIENGESYLCTGTLLNNLAGDSSPLFLTANHCVPNETVARTVEAFWFDETSSCNGPIPPLPSARSGARFLAGRNDTELSDFTLLEILGTLPTKSGFLPVFAGWTPVNPPLFASVTGIHHPGNSSRRISFGSIQFNSTDPNYHIVGWSSGTTEGGSSGSALFNSSHQVVGQLWGHASPPSSICTPFLDESGYGRFSLSYPIMLNPQGRNYLAVGLGDDSLEPNDTRAAARAVASGAWANLDVKYYGNNQGDDWYRINVPANYRVVAEARSTHRWGDIDVELYRGSEPDPVAVSETAFDVERISFQNGPAATDYFLRVFLFDDVRNTYNLTIDLALPPPTSITIAGVLNNAGYNLVTSAVPPGAIVAIFGSGLTDGTSCLPPSCNPTFGSNGRLNTTMAGAQVRINGTPVPIFYAIPGQLGIQIPSELSGTTATVQVSVGGSNSPLQTITIEAVSPGIFTFTGNGIGAGAFTHADGSPVLPENPAHPGEVVILYATGLGQVSPPVATGALPSGESRTVAATTVTIDGVSVTPDFAGLAGCCVGLNQVNVRIPENTRTANDIPVVLSIGGRQSNPVTIAVQPQAGTQSEEN